MSILFIDTETTGFPKNLPLDHPDQPWMVQLAAILADDSGNSLAELSCIIKPTTWEIPDESSKVHGITTEHAKTYGVKLERALDMLEEFSMSANTMVAHNVAFDDKILHIQSRKIGRVVVAHSGFGMKRTHFCTMLATTDLCKLPGNYGSYKWPKLAEAYKHFFNEELTGAHDALVDLRACMRIYFHLKGLTNDTGK